MDGVLKIHGFQILIPLDHLKTSGFGIPKDEENEEKTEIIHVNRRYVKTLLNQIDRVSDEDIIKISVLTNKTNKRKLLCLEVDGIGGAFVLAEYKKDNKETV